VTAALVIPTYQEAENIGPLLEAIRELCPDLHVIVCDDNSPDGTGRLADETANRLGGIEVIHRPGKVGLGAAYRHGFRYALDAGHDMIIQMDADFSHDPMVLPSLIAAVNNGADVAIGSRYVAGGSVPNWTWLRRQLSQWGNSYARAMLRLQMQDATTAFRAYRSTALEQIRIDGTTANGYLFQIETAYRLSAANLVITELPITFVDRVAGASKMAVARTMIETELRVTWWGLALRAPKSSDLLRRTALGRYMMSKIRPRGSPPSARVTDG